MLRWATIACLVAVNLSIWYGPFEAFRGTAAETNNGADTLHAEILANCGELDAALRAYQQAVNSAPNNPSVHFEYALFCYMYKDFLRDEVKWPKARVVLTVQEEFLRARSLDGDSFDRASQYALYLMDTEFFGGTVTRDQTLEAWDHVIALILERHVEDPAWPFFTERLGYALLQRARTESCFGETDKVRATLEEVRTLSPNFRIPDRLEQPSWRTSRYGDVHIPFSTYPKVGHKCSKVCARYGIRAFSPWAGIASPRPAPGGDRTKSNANRLIKLNLRLITAKSWTPNETISRDCHIFGTKAALERAYAM
jgi:hypothetical protein